MPFVRTDTLVLTACFSKLNDSQDRDKRVVNGKTSGTAPISKAVQVSLVFSRTDVAKRRGSTDRTVEVKCCVNCTPILNWLGHLMIELAATRRESQKSFHKMTCRASNKPTMHEIVGPIGSYCL